MGRNDGKIKDALGYNEGRLYFKAPLNDFRMPSKAKVYFVILFFFPHSLFKGS